MAEPRKPKVIRTRPDSSPGTAGARSAEQATAVRGTSAKVSVVPVPGDAGETPSAAAATETAKKPRAGYDRAEKARERPRDKLRRFFTRAASKIRPKELPKGSAAAPIRREQAASGDATVLAFPVPEYKRRRRNILYAVAGLAAVLAIVMAVALFSPVLAVKTVVLTAKTGPRENTGASGCPIISTPLPQVTGDQVQELLSSIVQVKSSQIEARPPSTLLIHIVERVPVALLKNDDLYLLVDQDGVELGSTTDPSTVALPLIDGGKAVIGQDTFRAITAVLANLPQTILSQLANATAQSPDAVELKLADGRSVIWGNASDMELKAQVLEALLSAPAPTAAAGKPDPDPAKVFDVSAPRHPVTR
nr:cell division protein FtsQ/DivIB [Arthrobacter polaris]UIK89672.1 cell division protein FtsQ/DivIB [Arthrobacter polaris]